MKISPDASIWQGRAARLLQSWPLMSLLVALIFLRDFLSAYADQLPVLMWQHLRMIALALPLAVAIGIPFAVYMYRHPRYARLMIMVPTVLMTIPSIALFGVLIPLLAPLGAGVGTTPAVVALILYSLLPVMHNTYTGLQQIPREILQAARGMGMSAGLIWWKIELPLAFPAILTGVRIALVLGVGVASVAAYIGGGGLGRWIFGGLRRGYPEMMLAGALLVALLALVLDRLLRLMQEKSRPHSANPADLQEPLR